MYLGRMVKHNSFVTLLASFLLPSKDANNKEKLEAKIFRNESNNRDCFRGSGMVPFSTPFTFGAFLLGTR